MLLPSKPTHALRNPTILLCIGTRKNTNLRIKKKATRICETCTFKTSSTCAYCDVCFFNRHPGLDVISKAEASTVDEGGRGAKAWALTAAKKQDGWNHRRDLCVPVMLLPHVP